MDNIVDITKGIGDTPTPPAEEATKTYDYAIDVKFEDGESRTLYANGYLVVKPMEGLLAVCKPGGIVELLVAFKDFVSAQIVEPEEDGGTEF